VCELPKQDGQKVYPQEEHSARTMLYSLAGEQQLGHFACFVAGITDEVLDLCSNMVLH